MIGHAERYALVTGASSGIGYELAKLFAEDGKNLVVVARNKAKLEQVKQEIEQRYRTRVKVLPKDLSDSKAPLEIFSELENEGINVDVLVNNAGFGAFGRFSETDPEKELGMIQVYVASPTHLIKLFLKRMLENRSGWILNVSSGMAFLPVPLFAVYAASKSYVLHFSEALANELRGTGVTVTCLCPGRTATSFDESASIENTKFANWKMMEPAMVAKAGYRALKRGRPVVVPGLRNQSLVWLVRILPRGLITKMMGLITEDALKTAPSK